ISIMIVGIGVDIIDIFRIENSLETYGERFRNRVFTQNEIAYCQQFTLSGERYAARFAAKEAARKAIGAAIPVKGHLWHDAETISSTEGAPQLRFHGRAAELIKELKVVKTHVSLSHAENQAIAFVVLEAE